MQEFDFSRVRTAYAEAVYFVFRLAAGLGLAGALIVPLVPDSAAYWHAASLAVLVLSVVIRSIGCARIARENLYEAD